MNVQTTITAETELEVSFRRTCERHGLKCLSLSYQETPISRFYSVGAHRDYQVGSGHGDTIEQALNEALANLNRKSAMIGMDGELPA